MVVGGLRRRSALFSVRSWAYGYGSLRQSNRRWTVTRRPAHHHPSAYHKDPSPTQALITPGRGHLSRVLDGLECSYSPPLIVKSLPALRLVRPATTLVLAGAAPSSRPSLPLLERPCHYPLLGDAVMERGRTTKPGFVNEHGQENLGSTGRRDANYSKQFVYVLRCPKPHKDGKPQNYGSPGNCLHSRRCEHCGGGAPGPSLTADELAWMSSN